MSKQNIYYNGRIYEDCKPERIHISDDFEFEYYLSTIPSLLYTGTNLKDKQVVVEGVDYLVQHQWYGDLGWWNCMPDAYYKFGIGRKKRIIAIGKPEIPNIEPQANGYENNFFSALNEVLESELPKTETLKNKRIVELEYWLLRVLDAGTFLSQSDLEVRDNAMKALKKERI